MNNNQIIESIVLELKLSFRSVKNTLDLLNEGCSVPFISRYRKEVTGGLDEVNIIKIRDLYIKLEELEKRRIKILETIDSQGKLDDELKLKILNAVTMVELEDLYLPYKPKRKTRASIALEKGLEGLAKLILNQNSVDLNIECKKYINIEKGVLNVEDALSGARDIIAEIINEDSDLRRTLRNLFFQKGQLFSKVIKNKKEEAIKYENYFNSVDSVNKVLSHRVLAIFRGEAEGFLRVEICPKEEDAIYVIERKYLKAKNSSSLEVKSAIADSYKRLLQPSLETELRNLLKEQADKKAISVFSENLRQLLMQAPLGQKRILAIDPGFRTGCKIVVLNELGQLLHNENIYPHVPRHEVKQSINKLISLVDIYKIEIIAIGNGTGGRETEELIKHIRFNRSVKSIMINESGASVYSASDVAREEFPDYDVTVRGAVSIGRRLIDPLAELVKIDPKSIGVGQYQHDVDQKELQKSLEETVVSCVNRVGVELNSASKELLKYVSGIGSVTAKNIVEYRNNNGKFHSRNELLKIPRFGEKVFQQAAGFLRIKGGANLLDNTAVHPESYHIVEKMLKSQKVKLDELMSNTEIKKNFLTQIKPEDFIDEKKGVGLPTIKDIINELDKPGRDPRDEFELFEFESNIKTIHDLKEGMVLNGIVTNITAFGAFVDIGVHETGLIHLSQMADKFVKDANDIVKLNQKLKVRVLNVDIERKRIQLSLKNI